MSILRMGPCPFTNFISYVTRLHVAFKKNLCRPVEFRGQGPYPCLGGGGGAGAPTQWAVTTLELINRALSSTTY